MNKKTVTILIVVALLLVVVISIVSAYNSLVAKDESATSSWAQVESAYQRRADLIPNLVNTVKGAADFEKGTLEAVVQARSDASSVKLDSKNLTPENMAAFQKAQDQLSGSLSRLMVVVERYPELKANQNFRDLQAQLEGTENRINVARQKFNDEVKEYNKARRSFPKNIIASMFGFEEKSYFEAVEGAEVAPTVEFNF